MHPAKDADSHSTLSRVRTSQFSILTSSAPANGRGQAAGGAGGACAQNAVYIDDDGEEAAASSASTRAREASGWPNKESASAFGSVAWNDYRLSKV